MKGASVPGKYEYLIFDADHTLIDFNRDEEAAFRRTFEAFGAACTPEDLRRARYLSDTVWDEEGLNDVHSPEVRRTYHEKYVGHLPRLFARIQESFPVAAPPEALAERFLSELNAPSAVLGAALSVFSRLSGRYKTCIATNGLTVMQTARLQAFLPYVHALFISQEVGAVKPDRSFFAGMLSRLGASAADCLFIGDSLVSDVAGCATVGMDCLWFNPAHRALPDGYAPVGQIDRIEGVETFLTGG